MSLTIDELSLSGAAEIRGLDRSRPFTPDEVAAARRAFRVHSYPSADTRHLNRVTPCGSRPV